MNPITWKELSHLVKRIISKDLINGKTTSQASLRFFDISEPLSWKELENLVKKTKKDLANGPTSSYSRLRLFGQPESSVRVTFYRYSF